MVIDLKVGKLSHSDLGQMLLYVNYYDREVVTASDNATIGLVLCSEKNDAVVRYVLADKHAQIFASRYQFALPSEDVLRAQIQRELELLTSGAPPLKRPSRKRVPADPKKLRSAKSKGKTA